ncbi:MAG TPA: hypothetical protein VFW19_15665 [Allosphingosinicella sp.]|nr:hypothetical protein [Allosphingosinicella sp.]
MADSTLYSRRKLLHGLGVGGVGVAAASLTSPLVAAVTANPLTGAVARAQTAAQQSGLGAWSAFVGKTFTIMNGTTPVAVTLVSLTAMPSSGPRPAGMRSSAIAAMFQGTNGPAFPAGNMTYMFKLPNGTPFQLFVGAKSVSGATGRLVAILN